MKVGRRGTLAVWMVLAAGMVWLLWSPSAGAGRISDIRRTKHNLSSINYTANYTYNRTVRAINEDQLCVFCHTPHGATNAVGAPLWNRKLSNATYTTYNSSSIQASVSELAQGPGGTSKLCLSCHDGTVAIGAVNVFAGQQNVTLNMTGTDADGTMPAGPHGNTTGFTRDLGVDLSNDHPISFTYNSTVAQADGELREPPYTSGADLIVGNRTAGVSPKPVLPLDNSQLQCSTCHDPHIRDPQEEISSNVSIKFLRLNRFQKTEPSGSSFSPNNDILCLACHDKGKTGWAESAHANSTVANEQYTANASTLREFPANIKVWEAACLNCHDTHTVAGSRRLLREGTDSGTNPKQGGNPAIEETCYQCHSTGNVSTNILAPTNNTVPNIKTEFAKVRHMPLNTTDQNTTGNAEPHDIRDADFTENQTSLGNNSGSSGLANRHVECTDCHNPHRVMRNQVFNGTGNASNGTHLHVNSTMHTNIASGVLRGSSGVEPVYSSYNFTDKPSSYTVKKGDGGASASSARSSAWVTREYQICLKCHSDYGYSDNGTYPTGSYRPMLDSYGGSTPTNTNNLTQYTNQAMEFNANANDNLTGSDQKEPGGNHRSWHPVVYPTGRNLSIRNSGNNWNSPWNGSSGGFIGNLTMYCTDCHGDGTANGTTNPNNGTPWGPHGSGNNFILKGTFTHNTGSSDGEGGICFKCHSYSLYATRGGGSSGFGGSKDANLHSYHADKIGSMKCPWCHVAVPHGWKNKALLVNLNQVGAEAGLSNNTQVRNSSTARYYKAPYYLGAVNKIKNWKSSGSWSDTDCGSSGAPGNNASGRNWMRDSSENCKSGP
ncbi:MAG: hypothetical protein HQL51_03830 [Magnetococcales bacterium]|nr:hypothetical protein [Magnetococcales bacterium]